MAKRMNLYFHDDFYNLLIEKVGRGNISQFIEDNLISVISDKNCKLEQGYRKMAEDRIQMQEAVKMANACIRDLSNEPW
jgi:hypothetical protein